MEAEQECSSCRKSLPYRDFYVIRTLSNGKKQYRKQCKSCYRAKRRQRQDKPRADNTDNLHLASYYRVETCPHNEFVGLLSPTGFMETLEKGYFPAGMIVSRKNGTEIFRIDGCKLVPVVI